MHCKRCGSIFYHYQGNGADIGKGIAYCSRACYVADFGQIVGITPGDIERAGKMGLTQKEAAERLRVSYPHFRRLVIKAGLRDHFPALGYSVHMVGNR